MDFSPPQDARRLLGATARSLAMGLAFTLGGASPQSVWAAAETLAPVPTWSESAPFTEANQAIEDWLTHGPGGRRLVAEWRSEVAEAPRAARMAAPLRRVFAAADQRLASLLTAPDDAPPAWLATLGDAEASFRLAAAEALAADQRYDACLAWTEELEDASVFSPPLLHYLRAVACRMTVDDTGAASEIKLVPEEVGAGQHDTLGTARRWVASALRSELETKAEPLPVVARRMRDVERRLALSEPGQATQDRQKEILDELDKLIEKLEEQRKQQQQQMAAGGAGGSAEPGQPAEESRPSELKGPGEVDRKRLVSGDAWGSLPPAERDRLTQSITRDFPPHYRALIEDYFRTLATEADATDPADPPADR